MPINLIVCIFIYGHVVGTMGGGLCRAHKFYILPTVKME